MFYPYLEGFHNWRLYLLYWCTVIYSAVAILAQVTFHIIWGIEGKGWIVAHSWWAKLVGFARYLNDSIICIDFCCVHVHVSAPWVQLSLYASYAGNIWIALNHDSWCRDQPWESPSVIYFLIVQLSAAVLSLVEVFGSRIHQDSCWLNFSFDIEQIGQHVVHCASSQTNLNKW